MAAISNTKTWTKIYRTVPGGTDTIKIFLRTLKNDLITAGFSHVASCDSVTTSTSVDLWDSDSDLVWAAAPSAHSWIVLQNNSMTSGFQVCIDLDGSAGYIRMYIANSAYSGGSTTAKPTATNEVEVTTGATAWTPVSTSWSRQYNMFYSSDGQCVRIYLAYNGNVSYGLINIEKIQNAPTWVSLPVVANVTTSLTIRTSFPTFGVCNFNGKKISVGFGGLVLATDILDLTIFGSGDYNTDWPCNVVYLVSNNTAVPGIFGTLADLWQGVYSLVDFDYFPGDGSKAQVVIGDLVQGSDGTTVSW
jgi:hypothetical protein